MATRRNDIKNQDEELQEWLESMDSLLHADGPDRAKAIFKAVRDFLVDENVIIEDATLNTPYRNSIPLDQQPAYPGDIEMEQRIENILRWNAMAMVLRGYDSGTGVGGHIGTFASAATMMEVGLNHFFRRKSADYGGDLIGIQAHAAPGVYARAFLEGRLSLEQLDNFRRELQPGGGLSSYPHPRNMPHFWQMPSASMGLSTPTAIYQARFAKYLERRGLKPANGGKVWLFIGDGEADEPEVLGTINIAAREKLDNLILVVNCNLQRLDGPVRGNGKIIQELERSFRGASWNVLKVIWSGEWDKLFAIDHNGVLQDRMEEAVDGDYQMYSVSSGEEVRDHWVGDNQELADIMRILSDEEIRGIRRGGHDHKKIFAAFDQATRQQRRADRHPDQDDQGLRHAGLRRLECRPSEEEPERRRTSRYGAADSTSRSVTKPPNAPNFTCRRPTVEEVEIPECRIGRCSAGRGRCATSTARPCRHRTWNCSRTRWPARASVSCRRRWRSCACCQAARSSTELGRYIVPIVPGRSAHVRHGSAVQQSRHLFGRRTEIPAGRQRRR